MLEVVHTKRGQLAQDGHVNAPALMYKHNQGWIAQTAIEATGCGHGMQWRCRQPCMLLQIAWCSPCACSSQPKELDEHAEAGGGRRAIVGCAVSEEAAADLVCSLIACTLLHSMGCISCTEGAMQAGLAAEWPGGSQIDMQRCHLRAFDMSVHLRDAWGLTLMYLTL